MLTREMLLVQNKITDIKYLFFWGHTPKQKGIVDKSCFSQWFPAEFSENGDIYKTAEHYMMVQKARLFGDESAAAAILATNHPNQAKLLGRKVLGFNEQRWDEKKYTIVLQANRLKFDTHPELKAFLLSAKNRVLVEASPYDKVWGIGLSADTSEAQDPKRWQGENLLGFALTELMHSYLEAMD